MASQAFEEQVQQLYIAYFGRPADQAGLDFYANSLEAGQTTIDAIGTSFGASAEAQATINSLTTQEFIEALYLQAFGRAYDAQADGTFWLDAIESGATTKELAFIQILQGAQNDDIVAVNNKVEVAQTFTAAVDVDAYVGADAAAQAKAVLDGVTADPATVTTGNAEAEATAAELNAGVGVIVDGETFTLTAGANTIAGTADNDVINALPIDAEGDAATTFSAFDSIDGGAGTDTLNIFTTGTENNAFPANATVTNVEIVNISNASTAATLGDASNFTGVEQLWQINAAEGVTNLDTSTTAGFRDTASATALNVTAAAAASSATVALDNVADASVADGNDVQLIVAGESLETVNVAGTLAAGTNDPATQSLEVIVTGGEDVAAVAVNSSIDATVVLVENAATATVETLVELDASGSTGDITFNGNATNDALTYGLETITTGTGDDDVTVTTSTVKDDTATAADETVTATVTTGAGDDEVTVNTSGTGVTNVSTGAGDDTVSITARSTTLNVNMGAGNDSFSSDVAITADDTIDAGEGTDTLLLDLVGAANVNAFTNFNVFDVAGQDSNLDLDILNANNTATEIVGSAALGATAVTLQNVTTNFRATGDMGTTNVLTLDQKTAGALTVTLDADEAGTADTTIDTASTAVVASDATSVSAVFDADYLASITGETATGDNASTINLSTVAATSVSVVSGGANATNTLVLTDNNGAATVGALDSLTITGSQAISVNYTADTDGSSLSSVDASALTGGLTISLAGLENEAVVTLGSGQDNITVTAASNSSGIESIVNFEKTAEIAVSTSTVAADVTARADAIEDADVLILTGGAVANANANVTTATISDGVLSFNGAGPATLADAISIADSFAETAGESLLFEYIGNSYVFSQGATHDNGATTAAAVTDADTVIKLTGTTDVSNFVETGTDNFFIV